MSNDGEEVLNNRGLEEEEPEFLNQFSEIPGEQNIIETKPKPKKNLKLDDDYDMIEADNYLKYIQKYWDYNQPSILKEDSILSQFKELAPIDDTPDKTYEASMFLY